MQSPVQGPVENTWMMGDGTVFTDSLSLTYTYQENGNYTVTHIIETVCGSDTSEINITVNTVDLKNSIENELNVWFANSKIIIDRSEHNSVLVSVYSIEGKAMFKGIATTDYYSIPTSGFSKGIYLVKIGNQTKKVVITD